jgi:transcriptional regulator with XRE-family HTH domain
MVDFKSAPSLGARIKGLRQARGVRSAAALAELIDNGSVSAATIWNIETGRLTNISVAQLLNIAFALNVAPSFLLAPLGRPDASVDLSNLTSGLLRMSVAEFDAWLSGSNSGGYRPTTSAEIAERNELAALRELDYLLRERKRLQTLLDLEQGGAGSSGTELPWGRTADKLVVASQEIEKIATYLREAGWSLDAWIAHE